MIEHVYRRASAASCVSQVIVATDDLRIATRVSAFGGRVRLTKATHQSGTDRLAELVAGMDVDIVVNVQGDEPFVQRSAITGAVRLVTDGRAMYFSRAPIPYLRDSEDAAMQRPLIWQHIGVYAYQAGALQNWVSLPASPLEEVERLEQLRPLVAGIPMGVSLIDEPGSPGIDTEADLERANRDWVSTIG